MSELRNLIGKDSRIEFAGNVWYVSALTFNDLCDLEDKFGDVASIDLSKASTQRYLLWLCLRDAEGSKERFENEYVIGEKLGISDPKQTADFVANVFRLCGLLGNDDTNGADAAGDEKKQPRKRAVRSQVSSAD